MTLGARALVQQAVLLPMPAMLCHAVPCWGSHTLEQDSDNLSSCRSCGIGFQEHSGDSLSSQATKQV